ncbi:MAG: HAD-IG family 5'-nucleotidase [Acidobacteriota bacterium]
MVDASDLISAAQLAGLPDSTDGDLLRHTLADRRPPEHRRIFTNRTLRMETIRFVGFDLDWTLADYDLDAMSRLTFELGLDHLVTKAGYPRRVRQAEYDPQFTRRGLIVDTEAGTVLKMNRHRYVGRAYRGRTYLDAKIRAELYRRAPINPASKRFHFMDTLFELPEINIFAELVELEQQRATRDDPLPAYDQLYRDVRRTIDGLHADGTLKSAILSDLPHYLPRDPDTVRALHRLALGGRKLLLITNSEWYYTDALCRHLFADVLRPDQHWRSLFDLVIVSAAKPGFFSKRRPFVELDDTGEPVREVDTPAWHGLYEGGNREGLMQLIDAPGEQVLYVGDHIYGDIFSSKANATWRTALVVREMEDELRVLQTLEGKLRIRQALRAELTDFGLQMDDLKDVRTLYRQIHRGASGNGASSPAAATLDEIDRRLATMENEHRAMRQHTGRLQREISQQLNRYWGSLFKQGANKSLFGSQVDDFACVYTSRASNFAYYGSNHYYRSLRDPMMHEALA